MVERPAVNRQVTGSSPVRGAFQAVANLRDGFWFAHRLLPVTATILHFGFREEAGAVAVLQQ